MGGSALCTGACPQALRIASGCSFPNGGQVLSSLHVAPGCGRCSSLCAHSPCPALCNGGNIVSFRGCSDVVKDFFQWTSEICTQSRYNFPMSKRPLESSLARSQGSHGDRQEF